MLNDDDDNILWKIIVLFSTSLDSLENFFKRFQTYPKNLFFSRLNDFIFIFNLHPVSTEFIHPVFSY